MALVVNIHEAKTRFSKLISRVGSGEEVVIAKAGKPVAKLVPVPSSVERRVSGSAKGKIVIAKDFDAPLPDAVLGEFEN
jgi:prevent-host-death family protein